ncbi:MAG: response regulator [Rickettsiales bacterium]
MTKILAVDDEEFNLDILVEYLEAESYTVVQATNGQEAWKKLEENPDVAVILLDRMMPVMDGMAFNAKIKDDKRFKDIPVIMQTAAAAQHEVEEGIKAGVFYYLTKPYRREMMMGIVRSAILHGESLHTISEQLDKNISVLGLMRHGTFQFQTLEQAHVLASFIAQCCPVPTSASLGLSELMVNAVEHGNLGITYAEKSALIQSGTWQQEVERRQAVPENQMKFAKLEYHLDGDLLLIRIKDEGKGFDVSRYLNIDPLRATHPNGRGIAMARLTSFDDLEYIGPGNEVLCTIRLKKHMLN